MEPWSTKGDRISVTTPEEVHRSDETPRQYGDLLALRAKRTLLHRLPEHTDRQEARAISGTKYHDGPHAPGCPAHRHSPKSGPPCRSNPWPDPTEPRPTYTTHPTHLPAPRLPMF